MFESISKIPKTPTDEELIEVLSAISIVSLRLAKKLRTEARLEDDECPCFYPMQNCPYRQERRRPHEAL